MSLAEVSRSMGQLAAAINKKTQELDELKSEYERKIRLVDNYISHLTTDENSLQELDEFSKSLGTLEQSVTCTHCNKTIYDMQKYSDFVLIPRSRLKISSTLTNTSDSNQVNETSASLSGLQVKSPVLHSKDQKALNSLNSHNHQNPQNHQNNRSKRTCSYCYKTGHSRARCFARLEKESAGAKPLKKN